MTGSDVGRIRGSLQLSPALFAALAGVHPSTVYRWEQAGDAVVPMEPRQEMILAVADQQLRAGRAPLAADLREALVTRGGLYGLYRLLRSAYGQAPPPTPACPS